MRVTTSRSFLLATLAAMALGALNGTASAQTAQEFYKGKQIRFVVGFEAGGGYDLYARAIAKHMGKHIPGNPTFVVQNMPGASSRIAANWLYTIAPKDGTVIATLGQSTAMDQALRAEGIRFEAAKFNWIGNPIVDNNITYAWSTSGIETIDDVIKKEGVICGGSGATSPSITYPQVLNNLLGTKIRIITGYMGGSDVNLAMERGEVNCRGSNSWSSTKATEPHWLEERKINVLVEWGLEKDPSVSKYQGRDVPLIIDLAKTEEDRQALTLLLSGPVMGRPIAAPPDVPADRVQALRKAFDATMTDPEFLADAKTAKLDIRPISGERLQGIAEQTARTRAAVLERSKALIEQRNIEQVKPK